MTWPALWLEALSLMGAPMDLPPPAVEILPVETTLIPDGLRGSYQLDLVRAREDECLETTLVHEFSRQIAIKTGRLNGVPNNLVKLTLDEIAFDVEKRARTWQPNCLMEDPTP